MNEQEKSLGRIEVAPEVLTMIAQAAVETVDGVSQMAPTPHGLFRRAHRHDGVVLDVGSEGLTFDIYVLMNPQTNLREASRAVQAAVIEAIDKMVGVPVEAVNVHVEDVVYRQGEAV